MPKLVYSQIKIEDKLGSGFFGTVHKGYHPIHGVVAIKKIKRLIGESDSAWTRRRDDLLEEGQHLKEAENERVVRVYDVFYDTKLDEVYLILELCDKGSLHEIYNQGPIPISLVRNWISDVALGLDCVHSRSLLHRDIKPANILIGNDERAKLGDFWLVTDRLVLGYGTMVGYQDHIAIEVWEDKKTSIRSDIWALGMTVYRLLHGEQYYRELNPPSSEVVLGGYADRLTWLAHIPKAWRSFVKKCMRDDPQKRYQNAQEILSALSNLPTNDCWICKYSPKKLFGK